MFKNGNTWPSIITVLLTLLIVILGFVVSKLDTIATEMRKVTEKAIRTEERLHNHIEQSAEHERTFDFKYAEKEWVRRNFIQK
jgi:hypothetical protein